MSLVSERKPRKNAGSKMSKLINEEEEDEFYKTAYGGFNEADDDQEFVAQESDFEEDYVDSDFDLDENEDNENEMEIDEDDERKQRKSSKKGVVTKAYKEPTVKKQSDEKKKTRPEPVTDENTSIQRENKSVRSSTARKREELMQRQEEREAQKKLKVKTSNEQVEYRRLTQEELLEEAKLTEKINLASLDAYQKMELEKKKKTVNKNVIKGPVIRYHSVSMPLISDQNEIIDKQSRNFIIFNDNKTLNDIFPQIKPKPPGVKEKICPITGMSAKYFDPLTKTPYANLFAFKTLRERHANENNV